jgi:hypothetical protein
LDHFKSTISSDDNHLLVAVRDPLNGIYNIIRHDTASGVSFFIQDEDGQQDNHVDFLMFDAMFDQLLTLIIRNNKYYLQMRNLVSLTLIEEY